MAETLYSSYDGEYGDVGHNDGDDGDDFNAGHNDDASDDGRHRVHLVSETPHSTHLKQHLPASTFIIASWRQILTLQNLLEQIWRQPIPHSPFRIKLFTYYRFLPFIPYSQLTKTNLGKCQDVGRCGQRLASESHWKRLVVFPPSWHGGAQGKDEYFAQSDFSQVPTGHWTVNSSGGPIRIHTTFQNSKSYPKIKRPLSIILFVLALTWHTSNLRLGGYKNPDPKSLKGFLEMRAGWNVESGLFAPGVNIAAYDLVTIWLDHSLNTATV